MGGRGRVKVALFIYLMLFSLLKVSWFQKTSWNPPFFQKLNKKNRPNYYGNSGRIVFVCFFEELKILKRHFEINWPLVKTFEFLAQSSVLTKAKQISKFLTNKEINIRELKRDTFNDEGIIICPHIEIGLNCPMRVTPLPRRPWKYVAMVIANCSTNDTKLKTLKLRLCLAQPPA